MGENTFNSESPDSDAIQAEWARSCFGTLLVLGSLAIVFTTVYAPSLNKANNIPVVQNPQNPGNNGYLGGTKDCTGLPGYSNLTFVSGHTIVQKSDGNQIDISGLPADQIKIISSSGADCTPFEYHDPNTGSTIVWYYIQTSSLPPGY